MMKPDPGLIIAGVTAMVAAAGQSVVSADDVLRTWSITGALGGALISTLMSDKDTVVKRLSKFIGSAAAGFIFTPLIIFWQNYHVSPDTVMGIAGAVSFMSWGILQVMLKIGPALFKRYIGEKVELLVHNARSPRRKDESAEDVDG